MYISRSREGSSDDICSWAGYRGKGRTEAETKAKEGYVEGLLRWLTGLLEAAYAFKLRAMREATMLTMANAKLS